MNNNGANDVQSIDIGNLNHGGCVFPALSSAFNWFQSLKSPCATTSNNFKNTNTNKIYPNPFSNNLSLSYNERVNVSIYALDGELLFKKDNIKDLKLRTSNWSKGMYILRAKNTNYFQNKLISKQ